MNERTFPAQYTGQVVATNDPDNTRRIQLMIPQVLGDAISPWAIPSVQQARIPAVGDTVLVTFKNADPSYPIYTAATETSLGIKSGAHMTGGGATSWDGTSLAWSAPLVINPASGLGAGYAPGGAYEIPMPTDGTLIPGYGGALATTAAGGRVPLPPGNALYYDFPRDDTQAEKLQKTQRFKVVQLSGTQAFQIPDDWVLIGVNNPSATGPGLRFANGVQYDLWHDASTGGGWAPVGSYGVPGFFKTGAGVVHLRGAIAGGSGPAFVLPPGYRPASAEVLCAISYGSTAGPSGGGTPVPAAVTIDPSGTITIAGSPGFVSLSGLNFIAAL